MRFTRWWNPSLPQMLQIAVMLLYIDAVFGVLFGTVVWFPIGTFLVVGSALGGLGVANELKWGWKVAVVVSALRLVPLLLLWADEGAGALLTVPVMLSAIFPIAQFALLVHPESRRHQKIWFN